MPPTPSTEILVHIAAASRATDDARYRDLVRAYAEFKPASRLNIAVKNEGRCESGGAADSIEPLDGRCATKCHTAGSDLCIERASASASAKETTFQYAHLSFASVWDNAQSPNMPLAAAEPAVSKPPLSRNARLFYVSPDDYIPDSQPGNEGQREIRPSVHKNNDSLSVPASFIACIDESQKSGERSASDQRTPVHSSVSCLWRRSIKPFEDMQSCTFLHNGDACGPSTDASPLELDHQRPASCAEIQSSLAKETGRDLYPAKSSSHELGEHSESTSPSGALKLGQTDSESLEKTAGTESRCLFDKANDSTQRPSHCTEQPLSKKRCLAPGVAEAVTTREYKETKSVGSRSGLTKLSPTLSPPSNASEVLLDESLCILSPEPPVACEHLNVASLITEKMAKLARDLDMARRYRPLSLPSSPNENGGINQAGQGKQEVRPFERGYWRLCMSSWPAALRQQAWSFLASYISVGDAGWSVWCSRDPAPHTWLRLYCFAATAGHTYLILYLASQRQILATGAEWLNGTDVPVIVVPPRRKKQ